MSLVLRHEPEKAGIALDAEGWANVDALLAGCAKAGVSMTHEALHEIVRTNDKQRFVLSGDGTRIRARQGHSVQVNLNLQAMTPPDVLYHGTVARFLDAILREGLKPMGRHHVHLSASKVSATKVGARRGAPVLLRLDAARMHGDGVDFYRTENEVWLVDSVPPAYIAAD